MWASRRRSLRKPHCLRGEVVLDGARADSVGIKFASWRLRLLAQRFGHCIPRAKIAPPQGPKRNPFQVVKFSVGLLGDRFHGLDMRGCLRPVNCPLVHCPLVQ